jgi:cytochrome P450
VGAVVSLSELLGEEGRRNPYPFYARLHELGQAAPLAPADRHAAVVHGYEAVGRVLRDPTFRVLDAGYLDRGGTRWREHPVLRTMQASMFNASGDDHARIRRLFGQALSPRRVSALEPAIARITDGLLDRLAEAGARGEPVDFMAGFALAMPSNVISELLGVPERDRAWFPPRVRAFDAVLEIGQRSFREIRAADAAAVELTAYFADLLAARRAQPRDDLVSTLARTQRDGPERLAEAELLANLIVLFNAGFRTTANLFGNGLPVLLAHPDALAALRADPTLAPAYVEEILRYEPPVHFAVRFAAEDTQVDGVPVGKGQTVVVLTGAANRDPRRFRDPDTFDPTRRENQHYAFSAGPHYCLGAALGRLEGAIGLPRLLARFPALALAAEPGHRRHLMLRGYQRLPLYLAPPAAGGGGGGGGGDGGGGGAGGVGG